MKRTVPLDDPSSTPTWAWCEWGTGSERSPQSCTTHRPASAALPGCGRAQSGSCPGSAAVMGRVTLSSDPGPACWMLLLLALHAPRAAYPRPGGTGGLWRGSGPAVQLCGLEAPCTSIVPWEHHCTSPNQFQLFSYRLHVRL